MEEISIKAINTTHIFFSFSENTNRVFNCNSIFFKNIGGQGNIIINDVFVLIPGAEIYIRSLNNEIDITPYKFTFKPGAGSLQGFYKMNIGVTEMLRKQNDPSNFIKPVSRMRGSKASMMNRDKKRK